MRPITVLSAVALTLVLFFLFATALVDNGDNPEESSLLQDDDTNDTKLSANARSDYFQGVLRVYKHRSKRT